MQPMTCGDATERGKGTQAYSGRTCGTTYDWHGGTGDDGRKAGAERGSTMSGKRDGKKTKIGYRGNFESDTLLVTIID